MTVPTSGTWSPVGGRLTGSYPSQVDTVQKHRLGRREKFRHPTYGEGEFIYLPGAASTAAGDAVTYNGSTFATTRAAAGAGIPWTVAFATAAVDATTKWGWYQISGIAVGNKTKSVSMAAGIAVGISTTALIAASSSLKELQNAWVAVVGSATTTTLGGDKIILNINYPHLQGRLS
jgi:hypothetical protein